MKKNYIKMNIDNNHLSFGNLCKIIKDISINKTSACQSEVFIALFNIFDISDSTINNYCVGIRGINDDYKQIYINYQKKYKNDKEVLKDTVINLLSIINGPFYENKDLNISNTLKQLCIKLYNLSKNDHDCSEEFTHKLNTLIINNNLLEAISEILFFIILEKKQPQYKDDLKVEIMENILRDTYISANDLKDYLNIKLSEEINFNINLKKLSNNGNAYACYELGIEEFRGYYMGYPRYDVALKYFEQAALSNHAQSYYMISKLYVEGLVGSKSNDELKYAYKCAKISSDLGCIAAKNKLGLWYLNGLYPVKKNINTAIKYFNESIEKNYSFSFNNLGLIYEKDNYEKAFFYYNKSASLSNSWAINKIAEKERFNKKYKEAYELYLKAIDSPINIVCFYAYYNLAKYYYLNGNPLALIEKDENKALEYYNIASDNNIIEASIDLLYIYVDKFLKSKDNAYLKIIYQLKNKIESNCKYNINIKKEIENKLKLLKDNSINLDIIK